MPPLKPRKTSPAQSLQAVNLKGYVLPLRDPNVPLQIVASPLACSRVSYPSLNGDVYFARSSYLCEVHDHFVLHQKEWLKWIGLKRIGKSSEKALTEASTAEQPVLAIRQLPHCQLFPLDHPGVVQGSKSVVLLGRGRRRAGTRLFVTCSAAA